MSKVEPDAVIVEKEVEEGVTSAQKVATTPVEE